MSLRPSFFGPPRHTADQSDAASEVHDHEGGGDSPPNPPPKPEPPKGEGRRQGPNAGLQGPAGQVTRGTKGALSNM